ncbi:MAG: hypothetical protein CME98_20195 [Hyphomonas sp.]|nr:hypothetical protein [Hyphomonas sp.]
MLVVQFQMQLMVEKVEIHLFLLVVKLQLPQMAEAAVENIKLTQMQELMVQVQEEDKIVVQIM